MLDGLAEVYGPDDLQAELRQQIKGPHPDQQAKVELAKHLEQAWDKFDSSYGPDWLTRLEDSYIQANPKEKSRASKEVLSVDVADEIADSLYQNEGIRNAARRLARESGPMAELAEIVTPFLIDKHPELTPGQRMSVFAAVGLKALNDVRKAGGET